MKQPVAVKYEVSSEGGGGGGGPPIPTHPLVHIICTCVLSSIQNTPVRTVDVEVHSAAPDKVI